MSNSAAAAVPPIPDHVPRELVTDFSFVNSPGMSTHPYETVAKLAQGPRILFNPCDDRGRASWLLTRGEDLRTVLWNPEIFSSKGCAGFSALVGESWDMNPLELDPPEHTRYRNLLNPLFTPKRIDAMEKGVRDTAVALIDQLAGQKGCEFMEAFGRPFPITVFLRLMGLPLDLTPTFLEWEHGLLHHPDMAVKVQSAGEILAYLRGVAAERKGDTRDDLASFVANAELDGEPLSDDAVIGIYYLLFVGGLDTVAASIGFFFKYLATHPEEQAMLRAHPEKRAGAIEELLRAHSVVITRRRVMQDTELAGVTLKQGDWVTVPYMVAGLDPEDYPDPLELKLDRTPNRHMAFAFGPHRCIGSHLARREFKVAFEEWFERMPPFRLKAGSEPVVHGGGVFGVDRLELEWD